jgi:Flp pilus assembly protein protease CpaA
MVFGFLFWLFLIGIVVASLQDLKRREVDNWLNVFLLVASFVFVFYSAIFGNDVTIIFRAGFALVIMFAFMNLFYYGRVFAGGDAKLLVAMTAFFVGTTFYLTLTNIGIFLLFLMLSGSVYGLLYSFVLYSKDFKKVNVEMQKVSRGQGWALVAGLIVMALGFVSFIFLVIGIIAVLTMGLYVFAKGLEAVSMIRVVSGKELREGDWLVDDVKVKGKTIKADWDGLSLEDIKLLKGKKKVKIKDGLPFVPAFLIAFLGYVFLKGYVLEFIGGLI